MFEENEQVVDSAETTTSDDLEVNDTSDDTDSEDETSQDSEGVEQHKAESTEQRSARLKRQIERAAKKEGKSVEEYLGIKSQEGTQESSKEVDDKYARLDLKIEGITSKKAQDVVLEYAKWKGIDHTAALKSPAVRAELAEIEKKTSAPPPSKRTNGGATDSYEYWVAQAKKGNFPTDNPEMMRKLQKGRIFTS